MKKITFYLLVVLSVFILTGCGDKNVYDNSTNNTSLNKNETNNNDNNSHREQDDVYVDDVEDNMPVSEEKVVVEQVINCDGCVYAYFNYEGDEAKRLGSTLSEGEYTTDINNLKTGGGKQRHNFFGLVLSGNTISRAYACILKDNKIYCIEGSVDGRYHENNIAILNQIFTADQCKYISAGHTYVCTDGDYNGDTITTGFASLHYETSCTIYGSDALTGKLICH